MFKRVTATGSIYPPLFSRYVEPETGVITFFDSNFQDEKSYSRRALYLQGCSYSQEVRQLLVEFNRGLPVQPSGNWESKVRDRRTLFVITGQQPGLFAGPLLVLYKALAAVKLARRLEENLQVPVQALFWVATEDHNVAPLLRSVVPLHGGGIERIRLPLSPSGLPAGMVTLADGVVADTLEQLRMSSNGRCKGEVMEWLWKTAQQGDNTLAGWFMQILSRLCSKAGLILFDPRQAAARGLYIPPLLKTLECSSHAHERIALAETELKANGFQIQVKRRGRESFIMITWEGRRYPLLQEGEHYFTPRGELSLSRSELIALIVEQPSFFSPGVLLRPLFQDILFPTLAYVAGPGELAYFAQSKALYPLFNMEMPLLYPRPGVTILEPSLQEVVARHDLNLDTLLPGLLQDCQNHTGEKARALRLLCHNLWPRSSPQERVFSIVPYLIAYGFSFWEDFCSEFPGSTGHYLYYWKEGVLANA